MEESSLARNEDAIERFFALPTVGEIVAALEADTSDFAKETAAILRKRSPLMLHVTHEHLRRARTMTLADDLRMERGLIRNAFHLRPGAGSETMEGIRALAIDKDQNPRWQPATLAEIGDAEVEGYFAPLGDRELHLD